MADRHSASWPAGKLPAQSVPSSHPPDGLSIFINDCKITIENDIDKLITKDKIHGHSELVSSLPACEAIPDTELEQARGNGVAYRRRHGKVLTRTVRRLAHAPMGR